MTDKLTKQIGANLKHLRREQTLTQVDLSRKAKMNSNYYAKIERGEIKPAVSVYERLAKALGVNLTDIFKG